MHNGFGALDWIGLSFSLFLFWGGKIEDTYLEEKTSL